MKVCDSCTFLFFVRERRDSSTMRQPGSRSCSADAASTNLGSTAAERYWGVIKRSAHQTQGFSATYRLKLGTQLLIVIDKVGQLNEGNRRCVEDLSSHNFRNRQQSYI
jgi:hypothetical protein